MKKSKDPRIDASTSGGSERATSVAPFYVRERTMRKLPLASVGGTAAVCLMAGAVQAEPVPLTLEQMDQMTAGQLSASVILTSSSEASSRSEVIGEGTAWASASASSSASLSFDIVYGDVADAE